MKVTPDWLLSPLHHMTTKWIIITFSVYLTLNRYPWESAYSGNDVTPEGTCDGCRERQIHVGASIAFAIRQYFSLTRDRDYLTSPEYEGCDVMKGMSSGFTCLFSMKYIYDVSIFICLVCLSHQMTFSKLINYFLPNFTLLYKYTYVNNIKHVMTCNAVMFNIAFLVYLKCF